MSSIATQTPGPYNVPKAGSNNKIDIGWISTVTTLADNSDEDVPTTKTVKTAVDGKQDALSSTPTFASLILSSVPVYLSNALAITGGLSAGMLYRTGLDPDQLCIVH